MEIEKLRRELEALKNNQSQQVPLNVTTILKPKPLKQVQQQKRIKIAPAPEHLYLWDDRNQYAVTPLSKLYINLYLKK